MGTLSADALSALNDQAMRALAPQLQDVLGTKNMMDTAMRHLTPQLQDMLSVPSLIEQVDWDAVLSSPEVQHLLDSAPRVLVPPSPEVRQKMDEAVGTQLGGVEQPTSTEVIAGLTLLFTIIGVIVSVVLAVHDWSAHKTTSPVTNHTTTSVTNNVTTVNVTNLPAAPPPCAPPGLNSRA